MNGVSARRRRFLLAGSRGAAAIALLTRLPGLRAEQRLWPPDASSIVVGLAFDAASQVLYKATGRAVHRSADGGRVWSRVELPKRSNAITLDSIAVGAAAPAFLPALYVAGRGAGVLRSDDGGKTWAESNDGLPDTDVDALTAHADRPETAYVYIKEHGIYRSEDGGRNWRLMDAGPRGGVTAFIHSNMPGSMQSGWFFVGGARGVRRAMDCFCGWRDAGELGHAARALAYDPHRPSEVYAAAKTGLLISRDGGETWSEIDAPATAIAALTVTLRGEIYAASPNGLLPRLRLADRVPSQRQAAQRAVSVCALSQALCRLGSDFHAPATASRAAARDHALTLQRLSLNRTLNAPRSQSICNDRRRSAKTE